VGKWFRGVKGSSTEGAGSGLLEHRVAGIREETSVGLGEKGCRLRE